MTRSIHLALLAGAMLTQGCDETTEPTRPDVVAGVTLDRTSLILAQGRATRLVATARDAAGRPLPGRTVTWSSTDTTVAAVSPLGVVTAIGPDRATIVARVEGKTARAEVAVVAPTVELLYSGSPSPFGASRLFLGPLDGAVHPVLPPEFLTGWNLESAAVSPDGSQVAFAALLGGEAYLYLVNIDGTNLRRLTHGGRESQPTWSPDGSRLAYVHSPPGPDSDIWVVNADGSNAVNITEHLGSTYQHSPAWSPALPGGGRIAFADGDFFGGRILTMLPDGSDVREVTTGAGMDGEPDWSPDGGRLVFTRELEHGTDLWIVVADGSDARPLLRLPSRQANPAWSPDGRLVAFSSIHEPGSLYDVYTVKTDGTELTRRSSHSAYAYHPAWRVRP